MGEGQAGWLGGSDDHPVVAAARGWLMALQACVRAVDFARARPLFAEEVLGFGTHAAIVAGRDALEHEQWRHVWPRIRGFTFRLDELRCWPGDAVIGVVVPWDSEGTAPDGRPFARPGRATVLLARRTDRWVAVHTHFSLAPVPSD